MEKKSPLIGFNHSYQIHIRITSKPIHEFQAMATAEAKILIGAKTMSTTNKGIAYSMKEGTLPSKSKKWPQFELNAITGCGEKVPFIITI